MFSTFTRERDPGLPTPWWRREQKGSSSPAWEPARGKSRQGTWGDRQEPQRRRGAELRGSAKGASFATTIGTSLTWWSPAAAGCIGPGYPAVAGADKNVQPARHSAILRRILMVALKASTDGDAPSVALTPVILRCSRAARASKDERLQAGAVALRGSLRSHLRVTASEISAASRRTGASGVLGAITCRSRSNWVMFPRSTNPGFATRERKATRWSSATR